jgi:hypothetical protein
MPPVRKRHHCPLCRHILSAAEYDRVLGIQKAREKELSDLRGAASRELKVARKEREAATREHAALQSQREALRRERATLGKTLRREFDQKLHLATANAKTQAQLAEKRKASATIRRLENNIKKAQIENDHLKNATTQSELGRAWDGQMADFIRNTFGPLGDQVEATRGSRRGDVIHNMRHNGRIICPIIIENKTGLEITAEFIRKANDVKRLRKARYVLLVSDGRRQGFEGGLKIEKDVILVRPAALTSVLSIIRDVHVELARSKASDSRIDEVSRNLKLFVQGEEFRTPIDAIVKTSGDLLDHLQKEQTLVSNWWKMRTSLYGQIGLDAKTIRLAVHSILEGKSIDSKVVPMRCTHRVS